MNLFYADIEIIGDRKFCRNTKIALDLILKVDRTNFNRIKRYITKIVEADSSVMLITLKTYKVGAATSNSDVEWYASTIIHDCIHSLLSHRWSIWPRGREERHEDAALRVQFRFLKRIGADYHAHYVKGLIGNSKAYLLVGEKDYRGFRKREW